MSKTQLEAAFAIVLADALTWRGIRLVRPWPEQPGQDVLDPGEITGFVLDTARALAAVIPEPTIPEPKPPVLSDVDWHMVAGDAMQTGMIDTALRIVADQLGTCDTCKVPIAASLDDEHPLRLGYRRMARRVVELECELAAALQTAEAMAVTCRTLIDHAVFPDGMPPQVPPTGSPF